MTNPTIERVGRLWADATQHAPVDEQRSLVRLLEAVGKQPESPRRDWSGRYRLAAAALVVCGIGLSAYGYRQWSAATALTSASNVVPGAWLETRRDQKVPMHFSEGSEVVVAEASRVRVASVDPRGASVVVERGSLRANIVHRSDTRWAFSAGPFNVRVTGTALRVGWRPERQELTLSVDEGSVVAEGPLLGDGRVVRTGETCSVHLSASTVHCTSSAPTASKVAAQPSAAPSSGEVPEFAPLESEDVSRLPLVEAESVDAAPRTPIHGGRGSDSMRELERAGKYAEALKSAEAAGLDHLLVSGSAEDLFCLSRLGRYQGRADLSRSALVQLRSRFAKTKEAANAAFLLGRQSAPAEAARWFSSYLAEQPQGTLAREASGRLMESFHRAGRFTDAQAAARRYLAAYPTGPHAGFAKSLLANP